MEMLGLQIDIGFDYFERMYIIGEVKIDEIDPEYLEPIYFISRRFSEPFNNGFQISYRLRQEIKDYLNELHKKGIEINDFISMYKDQPIVPSIIDKNISDIIDDIPIDDKDLSPYIKEGLDTYRTLGSESIAPQRILIMCWDCVENIIKSLLIQNNVMTAEKVKMTTRRDHLNRVRMTNRELIDEGRFYYDRAYDLAKKIGYIISLPDIGHILKKRNQLLRTRPEDLSQYGERDGLASLNSLRRAFPELLSLFSKSDSKLSERSSKI
jgi:hypothetical protein